MRIARRLQGRSAASAAPAGGGPDYNGFRRTGAGGPLRAGANPPGEAR